MDACQKGGGSSAPAAYPPSARGVTPEQVQEWGDKQRAIATQQEINSRQRPAVD